MAKKSQVVRQQRPAKYKTREYNRCRRCGRPRAYLRKFGLCRICVREQIIFPEIDYDAIDQVRGLDVVFTTSAQTDEEAFALLEAFGMPFRREGRPGGTDTEAAAAAEEEQRKEEARARAEAEQAALEQLKEENPEAYAKREPKLEGEEAEAAAETDKPEEPAGPKGPADDGQEG